MFKVSEEFLCMVVVLVWLGECRFVVLVVGLLDDVDYIVELVVLLFGGLVVVLLLVLVVVGVIFIGCLFGMVECIVV